MINTKNLAGLFSLFRQQLVQAETHLNALDGEVGDGDHGFTMVRAFKAAERTLLDQPFANLGIGFDLAAQALAENAGGAIGPLMASLFSEGGLVFRGKDEFITQDLAAFLIRGLASVQEVGGAKVGDKTLIDALAPAAQAVNSNQKFPLTIALAKGVIAAEKGAASTISLKATHGRAQWVAERSKGHQDAGATSMALLIQTVKDFVDGQRAEPESPVQVKDESFIPPSGRFINKPEHMIAEDNQGLASAYPRLVRLREDGILYRAVEKETGKTALVIGHGGGHTPSMGGFVGPGLLDADVYGPLFTCASGVRIAEAVENADRGAGVLLLVSNHSGDVLNARLAARRARTKGIQVESVLLGDDLATAERSDYKKRRGLGGMLFALKIGGAAAEAGLPLAKTAELMRKTNQRTATLSVSGRAPFHPVSGTPLFKLPAGQIEVGTGVHGEIGVYRGDHMKANDLVDLLLERLVDDLQEFEAKQVLVFLNGAGGTSRMELHILYNRVCQNLGEQGIQVAAGVVDSYFTTLEMGGFSLSLCAVDDELMGYWEMPASGPCFRWPYM